MLVYVNDISSLVVLKTSPRLLNSIFENHANPRLRLRLRAPPPRVFYFFAIIKKDPNR